MTKIYAIVGNPETGERVDWMREDGVVLATRPASREGWVVPTALVMVHREGETFASFNGGIGEPETKRLPDRWVVYFCCAHKTGSYEHANWASSGKSFASEAAARAYAATWA